MSDTETGTGNAEAPSEATAGPPISILHQYTKDLSFENPGAPQVFVQEGAAPEVNINVDVNVARLGERDHEVSLQLTAHAKTADNTLFMAELVYCGLVRLGEVPDEHVQPLLMIEAPRLFFPYARNIISDTTRDGGFPALMIGYVDFVELYRRRLEGLSETAGGAPAAPKQRQSSGGSFSETRTPSSGPSGHLLPPGEKAGLSHLSEGIE